MRRTRLSLEHLESRWVPAVSVTNSNGVVNVTGDPEATLTATQTAANQWTIDDGGNSSPSPTAPASTSPRRATTTWSSSTR